MLVPTQLRIQGILTLVNFQATFYVSGCLGIAWCVFWILLVSDDPKNNRWISQKEKDGIIKNRTDFKEATDQKPLLQMKKILCTPTIWFCALDDFGFSMALNIIMVEGPTFINDFLGKDISQVMLGLFFYNNTLRSFYKNMFIRTLGSKLRKS